MDKKILEYTKNMTIKELKNTQIYKKLPKSFKKSSKRTKKEIIELFILYINLCESVKKVYEKYPDSVDKRLKKICNIKDIKIKNKEEIIQIKKELPFYKRFIKKFINI